MTNNPPKLTSLSHGGGCGCKIAPDVLAKIMANAIPTGIFPKLMVGTQTADDAAVYKLNNEQALIATTDFFMPIVDDPTDFGKIAATNALSDVYAMGGKPIMALALVGMPLKVLPEQTIASILAGGAAVCQQAGIPIAGGHSIDSVEPIYGLAVMGLAKPESIKCNNQARPGDKLILSKALGVGILSAALKKDLLPDTAYKQMLASTTQLNTAGFLLAEYDQIHAMTDVTGFSLLGHALELCKGSNLQANIQFKAIPWLEHTLDFIQQGIFTGASGRNWNACKEYINISHDLPNYAQTALTDPQTSGGLLIACAPEFAEQALDIIKADGFNQAAIIGELHAGKPSINIM